MHNMRPANAVSVPEIAGQDSFDRLVRRLAVYVLRCTRAAAEEPANAYLDIGRYFVDVIETPGDFEERKGDVYGTCLKPLVRYLIDYVHHEAPVCALL